MSKSNVICQPNICSPHVMPPLYCTFCRCGCNGNFAPSRQAYCGDGPITAPDWWTAAAMPCISRSPYHVNFKLCCHATRQPLSRRILTRDIEINISKGNIPKIYNQSTSCLAPSMSTLVSSVHGQLPRSCKFASGSLMVRPIRYGTSLGRLVDWDWDWDLAVKRQMAEPPQEPLQIPLSPFSPRSSSSCRLFCAPV